MGEWLVMARVNLIGQKFGRLTVLGLNEEESSKPRGKNGRKRTYWNCQCDCGNVIVVRDDNLTNGNTKSCGCSRKEHLSKKWQDEDYRKIQSEKMSKRNNQWWQDEEYREKQSQKMSEQNKKSWQDEEFRQKVVEAISGENNYNWKGGITPIANYLRNLTIVEQWRKDTYIRENSKCQLTGKHVHGGNSDVHHLYNFNMIVREAHTLHNIQIKQIVGDYTKEELQLLEDYVTSWHKDTSNAVLLCKEIHILFHIVFMGGYDKPTTKEDYIRFKQRYLNGEFNVEEQKDSTTNVA